MSNLYNATNATGRTANGARTLLSSTSPVVDLFFVAGSARNMSENDLASMFGNAYGDNPELTARLLQWLRDCRGGAGERNAFRVLFNDLLSRNVELAGRVLSKVPELGRWDDVLVALDTPLEDQAIEMIQSALENDNGLCAKWMPRQGKVAAKLRDAIGYSPKRWRKTLVGLTKVVETQMCSGDWDNINYEHVPSVAMSRYRKAFERHGASFEKYVEKVTKGEAKINAGAVFPHDIIRGVGGVSNMTGQRYWSVGRTDPITATERAALNAQWNAMPNFLAEDGGDILPVIDVSGSMYSVVSGSTTAMDVAVALGLYVSERMNGKFKGEYITFSGSPKFSKPTGDVIDKMKHIASTDVGYNTDFQAVFDLILNTAKRNGLSQEDMPSTVLVFSDMEFDHAGQHYSWRGNSETNFEALTRKYEEAGYQRPNLVFWNINGRMGNSPVTSHETGTALVSGFSPSIVKNVLMNEFTPEKVMLKTLMDPRYDL